MIKNQIIYHWLPALFCAFLVFISLRTGSNRLDALQGLVIWLPMCFFYVSAISYSMQKQIRELQAEVKELQGLKA